MSLPLLQNLPSVAQRVAKASHLLLGLDYDGTLTPIVDDPAQALLKPETRDLLRLLVGRSDVSVAIISGRSLDELRALVGVDGPIYAGNHGLEICGQGLHFLEPTALKEQKSLCELARILSGRLEHIPEASVEDKGLTLTVHFRGVPRQELGDLQIIVENALRECNRCFSVRRGKEIFDVRPQVSWNKGNATSWIRQQIGNLEPLVIYLGDDQTDEDAFLAFPGNITIKIGDPANTAAHYHVESPADVRQFLRWLEGILQERGIGNEGK